MKPHKEAADKILGQVDDQLRRAMEQAAKYRLQHHKQRLLQQAKDEDQFVASTSHPKYAAIMEGRKKTFLSTLPRRVSPSKLVRLLCIDLWRLPLVYEDRSAFSFLCVGAYRTSLLSLRMYACTYIYIGRRRRDTCVCSV